METSRAISPQSDSNNQQIEEPTQPVQRRTSPLMESVWGHFWILLAAHS